MIKQNIYRFLRQNRLVLFIRLFLFNLKETIDLSKNLGSANLYNIREKFEAHLIIKYHAIEKGLALPKPRIGFGEQKVNEIITLTYEYYSKFSNKVFLGEHLNILDNYFDFQMTNGHTNNGLYMRFHNLKEYLALENVQKCGVVTLDKATVLNAALINFEKFVSSRYSVRDFSDMSVSKETIEKAIEIAKKSPSACNRQPWHVYVYKGDRKLKLLKWQGGTPGFTDSIDTAILITCDYNGYFIHEKYQPYVDGGLYAMTLMYAFHSLGIGTVPLTTAKKNPELKILYKNGEIPTSEIPVMILGIGNLKDSFKVAISHRINPNRYTKFID